VGVRKDSGRFRADPQAAYTFICAVLQEKQIGIEDLFWCEDINMFLVKTFSKN